MSMNTAAREEKEEKSLRRSSHPEALPLGQILLESGRIREADLEAALRLQRQYAGRIGEVLVNQGACTEEDVLLALSRQLELPRLQDWGEVPENVHSLNSYGMDSEWWLRQKSFPLGERNGKIWVAMADPLDGFVPDTLWQLHHVRVEPVLVTSHELRQLMALLESSEAIGGEGDESLLQDLATGAPVIQFVNDTIQRALDAHASDIHFETYRGVFRVRFRIDGVLHEIDRPGVAMQAAVISRLKLMAGLDIAEKRLPQDGRIRMKVGGTNLDIRVATSPGIAGENVVLRLLVSEGGVERLTDLRMCPDHERAVRKLLGVTNGIILVTGPTGSGKSTTLYAFLRELMSEENKIITVEDPVEYQTPGITQIPVNAEIGLTFAKILRSVLRQDPDIVLIGEIRDRETAEIAVQAALTGHLVLSTLHTNDAPSAFVRLMDMGVEPYLLASSVIGVLGQRLVRKVCPHCREPDLEAEVQARSLGWARVQERWHGLIDAPNFVRGRGCEHCVGSGFRGRRSIFEVLPVDEELRHVLATHAEELAHAVQSRGVRSMLEDGLIWAARGETTVTEVLRVAG